MMTQKPESFILDVDGVLTTGQFLYTSEGKAMKVFGPDDHDALELLRDRLEIVFVTGDHRGYPITKSRVVDDMNFPLELVSTAERIEWIRSRQDPATVIYMGDGIFDHYVFQHVGYSICPSNGFYLAKERADFVTHSAGGDRAVAEACLHILERFLEPFDPDSPLPARTKSEESL